MITVIRKEEQETKEWSGGTTTQLYIYPENSSYKARNFQFRISTASVDVEESTFTRLPNVSRSIMILEGKMDLFHKGQHNIKLNKFETDNFSGDWDTTSRGKVIDFNLMTTGENSGSIDSSILKKGESFDMELLNKISTIALYIVKGEMNIKIEKKELLIKKGDIVIYNRKDNSKYTNIIAKKHTEIAIAIIQQ